MSNKVVTKNCVGCNEEKDKKAFRRNQIICQECEVNPEIVYDKKCVDCGETKPSNNFREIKVKGVSRGTRTECCDCEKKDGRNYRRTTTKAKEWVENNPEKMAALQKKSYEENKPLIRQQEKDRFENDPLFREIKTYRSVTSSFLLGRTKTNLKLGDITRQQFIDWLEFCFTDEMTVENHHKVWHIDHVLPLDMLKDNEENAIIHEENARACIFAWYNTMPLTIKENRKKSSDISKEHLISHLKNLKSYHKQKKIQKTDGFYKYKKVTQKILDNMS